MEEDIKEKINQLVGDITDTLKKELSDYLESITLIGSYAIGKISLERPNINILLFTKPNINAETYLRIGEIFYKVSKKYEDYFGVKIDSLPFKYGLPTSKKELQVVLSPNFLSMIEKDQKPLFGVPHNVLEGMKATRKVIFGSDPLANVEPVYTKRDLYQWAIFDVGVIFRNLLLRTPISYDVEEHLDLLAHDSLELGKSALYWGVEIFMDEEDIKKGNHIKLINDKNEMVNFFSKEDKELGDATRIILEARENFKEYKKSKDKASKLYNASFIVVNKIFFKVLSEIKKWSF